MLPLQKACLPISVPAELDWEGVLLRLGLVKSTPQSTSCPRLPHATLTNQNGRVSDSGLQYSGQGRRLHVTTTSTRQPFTA